jgi:hypothetical protein
MLLNDLNQLPLGGTLHNSFERTDSDNRRCRVDAAR